MEVYQYNDGYEYAALSSPTPYRLPSTCLLFPFSSILPRGPQLTSHRIINSGYADKPLAMDPDGQTMFLKQVDMTMQRWELPSAMIGGSAPSFNY
jgi:hypothetical protein